MAARAAIQGAALAEDHFVDGEADAHPLLLDVTPQPLGVQTVSDYFEVIVDQNTQIPCESTQVFTTTSDDQTVVRVRVYRYTRTRTTV